MIAATVNIPRSTLSRHGSRRPRSSRRSCSAPSRQALLRVASGCIMHYDGELGMRVLLADDHALVRAGIRALLAGLPDVESVVEAGDGQEALAVLRETQARPRADRHRHARAQRPRAGGAGRPGGARHAAGDPVDARHARPRGPGAAGGRQRLPAEGRGRRRAAGVAARGHARRDLPVARDLEAGRRRLPRTDAAAAGRGRRRRCAGRADVAAARDPAARRRGEVDQGGRAAARPQREDGRDPPRPDHGAARHSRPRRPRPLRDSDGPRLVRSK